MLTLPPEVQAHLLGRAARDLLMPADHAACAGRRVLVTGAGGSIGAELARLLAACHPARLTLVDHSEYALFRVESDVRRRFPAVDVDAVLGDVSRRVDIQAACRRARPHAVYHAAAYKHVPIVERTIVPAVRSNVLGTAETVRAARDAGARFVLVSSDKAAEPTSVMGATKRLAELVALGAATPLFRPIVVRFGNVLGSSGSLVEVMWECVQQGRNVPLTDPGATRFFMTATEAVALVIKADLLARRPEVFWLDMGEPLRIGALAERFIAWATPEGRPRVGIDVVGLRPGEKLHEELTTHGLDMRPTPHARIMRARQRAIDRIAVADAVKTMRGACARGDAAGALNVLREAVTGFVPSDQAVEAARSAWSIPPARLRASA